MADWKEYKIKDAPFEIIDGDRGTNYPSQNEFYSSGHCLFLSAKNVKKTGFDFSERQFISEEKDNILRKGKLKRNDTVLTTRGTVGNLAFYNDQVPFDNIRLNSGMVIIRPFEDELKPKFCFYLFRALQQNHFEIFTSGSAQPQLPIRDLNEIEISIPEPDEQQAIAEVLSSLDDKIDLLHRQNKTLEALAETLFRQWFVEEADESWAVGKLDDVISVKGGTTPSTGNSEFWNGSIHWTSPRDLSNHTSVFLVTTERKITEKGLNQIGSGLLPVGTVLLSSRAPIGYLAITDIPVAINQGYIAIVCNKTLSNYFAYLWSKNNLDAIINAANGSVFIEISKSTFRDLDFQIPPQDKLDSFDEQIRPIFQRIKSNVYQIRTLTNLRDELLPKLMSGELRVELVKDRIGDGEPVTA
jgi:type I restriction enzyme S subunit